MILADFKPGMIIAAPYGPQISHKSVAGGRRANKALALAYGRYRLSRTAGCDSIVIEDKFTSPVVIALVQEPNYDRHHEKTRQRIDPMVIDSATEWRLHAFNLRQVIPYELFENVKSENEMIALEMQAAQDRMEVLRGQETKIMAPYVDTISVETFRKMFTWLPGGASDGHFAALAIQRVPVTVVVSEADAEAIAKIRVEYKTLLDRYNACRR